MTLSKREIFEIHQLKNIGYKERRIAKELGLSRPTVRRYIIDPCPEVKKRSYHSQLEPYYPVIGHFSGIDNKASAVVIYQRLVEKGYKGAVGIIRDYLRNLRGNHKKQIPYLRYESSPGETCQLDWGYFGTLKYGKDYRKLWCFAMIECYSRMLYLEFTHSCNIDVFIACHVHAFSFFGGTPRELLHDNLKTAVIERDGKLIRFNERYLDFLRPLHITPRACNPGQPHEKGKIEKGGIHLIRYNFWPLRNIIDVYDANNQGVKWRDEIANVRIHRTTRERPVDKFKEVKMRPFLKDVIDTRETKFARIYSKDYRVYFDYNYYSAPPGLSGKDVVAKADNRTVTIYYKDRSVATHKRCWEKNVAINTPGHIKKLLEKKKGALASKQQEYFLSLAPIAKEYLESLTKANLPVKKNIYHLLRLKDSYGVHHLIEACKIALKHNAFGYEYVENILLQNMYPRTQSRPVIMKQKKYNDLLITEADLAFYDNLIFENRKENSDE